MTDERDSSHPRVQDFASRQDELHLETTAISPTAQVDNASASVVVSPSRVSIDSTLRRRPTRSKTVRHYNESPTREEWEEPGAEPGIDTAKGSELQYNLQQHCDITVVDFSDERVECRELDNDSLERFLKEEKESWVGCRWINVNGLSWDVIRSLGNYKHLHPLAIEDLMKPERTKADWYSDQAFREEPSAGFSNTLQQADHTHSPLHPLETGQSPQRRLRQRFRLGR